MQIAELEEDDEEAAAYGYDRFEAAAPQPKYTYEPTPPIGSPAVASSAASPASAAASTPGGIAARRRSSTVGRWLQKELDSSEAAARFSQSGT